jgi:predicted DNA-binding transcriptional regulator AlpA
MHGALMERLLTARDLADELGLSADWILDEWQAGRLPGLRLSARMIRFRVSDIEEWLTSKQEGPKIPPVGGRELRAVR